jgi:glutamate 5-kinase
MRHPNVSVAKVLALRSQGIKAIIVSSGAITAGMSAVDMANRPTAMPELQRLASIGWRHLLNAWDEALGDTITGSILLTRHELDLTAESAELLGVTHTMLSHGDAIIANENDVITHEEIAFGDNDRLAAIYAAKMAQSGMFGTVGLVVLSDINGLYQDKDDPSSAIGRVDTIDRYMHLAGGAGTTNGTGGMKTKFDAARIATEADVTMWIANGRTEDALQGAINGKVGTQFSCRQMEEMR